MVISVLFLGLSYLGCKYWVTWLNNRTYLKCLTQCPDHTMCSFIETNKQTNILCVGTSDHLLPEISLQVNVEKLRSLVSYLPLKCFEIALKII